MAVQILEIPVKPRTVRFDGEDIVVLEMDALCMLKEESALDRSAISNPLIVALNCDPAITPDRLYLKLIPAGPGSNPAQDDNGPSLHFDFFVI